MTPQALCLLLRLDQDVWLLVSMSELHKATYLSNECFREPYMAIVARKNGELVWLDVTDNVPS